MFLIWVYQRDQYMPKARRWSRPQILYVGEGGDTENESEKRKHALKTDP